MTFFKSDPKMEVAEAPKLITESVPEEAWYWAAIASIMLSLFLKMIGRDHLSLFVGQWPPTFLLLGLYRRLNS